MIVFSEHVIERLVKRKIKKAQVLQTVEDAEEIIGSSRGRKLRRKRFGNRILEAVTITEGTKITVITAYYLEENYEN